MDPSGANVFSYNAVQFHLPGGVSVPGGADMSRYQAVINACEDSIRAEGKGEKHAEDGNALAHTHTITYNAYISDQPPSVSGKDADVDDHIDGHYKTFQQKREFFCPQPAGAACGDSAAG